jgi:hypothetical protein
MFLISLNMINWSNSKKLLKYIILIIILKNINNSLNISIISSNSHNLNLFVLKLYPFLTITTKLKLN